jgi:GPH family glycoside/pentoside/hexuronide:cation symporter
MMDQNPASRKKKPRKFGRLDTVAYAAGDFGCNMSFALKSTLAIFWTQYMGLELIYSVLLIIVQIWDAVNDPLIGSLIDSDQRKYKTNKFIAYINVGALGLLVGGALCFLPFPEAPLWAQVIIFVAGYVIWDAFYTIVNVPYGSLLSLISDSQADRASLSAWRSIGSIVGNMLPMAILPFIIYDNDDNLLGERVFIIALIMGIIGYISFKFMIKNTVIRVNIDMKTHEKTPKFNFFKALRHFVKNRPALGTTIAAMGMILGMQGGATAVTVLFQSYFKNIDASGLIQVISMLPIIVFTPFASRLVMKYGKKELSVAGAICSIVACLAMLILPITPNNTGIAIYLGCQILNGLGIGIFSTVSWAMMGDAVDYNEWKHGRREEGIIYSLHSFFRKLSQGLGPSAVLIIMYALGYVGTNKGNQTLSVATNIRYLVAALYLFSAVTQFIGLTLVYDLDKKRLSEMNSALGRNVEDDDLMIYRSPDEN